MNTNVSVNFPIYSLGQYFENCLKRLFDQSYTDFDVLLINSYFLHNSENTFKKCINNLLFSHYKKINNRVSSAKKLELKK